MTKATCLVTLHGVGFQRTPAASETNSGYADQLHIHLRQFLKDTLSDDPQRQRAKPGDNGPIYVESRWPDSNGRHSREEGLKRLGAWRQGNYNQVIDLDSLQDSPLLNPAYKTARITHVALVYSKLEPQGRQLWPGLTVARMAAASLSQYATFPGLLRMVFADMAPVIASQLKHLPHQQRSSLIPRNDLKRRKRLLRKSAHAGTLTTLEDDVACYVCDNQERERVRSFVHGALMRLGYRDDVDRIILNAHSNGTVIAFDVLHYLPQQVIDKISVFSTAGSPLRKYVDLFRWGDQVQSLTFVKSWHNFWDAHDLVADPLDLPLSRRVTWHNKPQPANRPLFTHTDFSGNVYPIAVTDQQVDNLQYSAKGGVQAHNYWDNRQEVVAKLAEWLR